MSIERKDWQGIMERKNTEPLFSPSQEAEHVQRRNESITKRMLLGATTIPAINAWRTNEILPGGVFQYYDMDTDEPLSDKERTRRMAAVFAKKKIREA